MNINEIKNIIKLTKEQENVIISELGEDLEIIDPMYEDLVKNEVSNVSGGNALGVLMTLDNPLLGRFLVLSGDTYITSKKTNDNLQWLLYHNAKVYEQAKADVLEVLELTESDYQLKLIERVRSEIDKFNNE